MIVVRMKSVINMKSTQFSSTGISVTLPCLQSLQLGTHSHWLNSTVANWHWLTRPRPESCREAASSNPPWSVCCKLKWILICDVWKWNQVNWWRHMGAKNCKVCFSETEVCEDPPGTWINSIKTSCWLTSFTWHRFYLLKIMSSVGDSVRGDWSEMHHQSPTWKMTSSICPQFIFFSSFSTSGSCGDEKVSQLYGLNSGVQPL